MRFFKEYRRFRFLTFLYFLVHIISVGSLINGHCLTRNSLAGSSTIGITSRKFKLKNMSSYTCK